MPQFSTYGAPPPPPPHSPGIAAQQVTNMLQTQAAAMSHAHLLAAEAMIDGVTQAHRKVQQQMSIPVQILPVHTHTTHSIIHQMMPNSMPTAAELPSVQPAFVPTDVEMTSPENEDIQMMNTVHSMWALQEPERNCTYWIQKKGIGTRYER